MSSRPEHVSVSYLVAVVAQAMAAEAVPGEATAAAAAEEARAERAEAGEAGSLQVSEARAQGSVSERRGGQVRRRRSTLQLHGSHIALRVASQVLKTVKVTAAWLTPHSPLVYRHIPAAGTC